MVSVLLSGPVVRRSRRALLRACGRVIFAVPGKWRGMVASRVPSRLLPPEMLPGYFDHFFDEGDPFGFDRREEERLKFARTLEVCGAGPLGRVMELGCAVGSFTELLAPRASRVLAVDASQAAVDRVAARLEGHPNVEVRALAVPAEFPEETFDLVIASDVLYYLPVPELRRCVERIEASMTPGAALVLVHYVPRMGSVLDGDETHDVVAAHTSLRHVLAERTEFGAGRTYRIDRFDRC